MIRNSTWFVLSGILAATAVSSQASTLGFWQFEEGAAGSAATSPASILDSSGNGYHGTPLGGPLYSATTPDDTGLSLDFDGSNDVVEIPHNAALGTAGPFTIEFWIRSPGTGSGQDLLVDKSHGFTDSTGWVFQSQPGTGVIFFGLGLGGGGPATNFQGVLSTGNLFDNEWHHLAGTYDGNTAELFVDGVSQGTNAVGTYVGNTRPIRIGNTWQSSRYFGGQFDDLRISGTVLTADQLLVPEPSTMVMAAGIGIYAGRRRRSNA